MNKVFKVKCPQCDIIFSYYESEFRPFCCERCKMIDLGHWFEESYRVPTKEYKENEKQQDEDQESEQFREQEGSGEDEEDGY